MKSSSRTFAFRACVALMAAGGLGQTVWGQDAAIDQPAMDQATHDVKLKLSKDPQGTVAPRKERMFNGRPVSEIRQARAIYRADQRILRIEHNRWAGHSPLRPNISGNPDLFNGINTRRTIYIPVFVR